MVPKSHDKEKCEECDGKGWVYCPIDLQHRGAHVGCDLCYDDTIISCPKCDGYPLHN